MLFSILQELIYDMLVLQVSRLITRLHYTGAHIEINITYQNKEGGHLLSTPAKAGIKLHHRLNLVGGQLIVQLMHDNGWTCMRKR